MSLIYKIEILLYPQTPIRVRKEKNGENKNRSIDPMFFNCDFGCFFRFFIHKHGDRNRMVSTN